MQAEEETGLKRSLRPRHMTMISLAGVIGAGLFVGSGARSSSSCAEEAWRVRSTPSRVASLLVRWRSIVGAAALALTLSAVAIGPAFAQTPAPPKPDKPKAQTPPVAPAPPADATKPVKATAPKPSAEKPKAADPKPKAEKPKAADPKPKAEKPKAEKPKPADPKPKAEKPKAEKPKPADPKPKAEKPKAEKPKPADPKPAVAKPKPTTPAPSAQQAAPSVRAQASAPTAQEPSGAGAATQPTRPAAHKVDPARARPGRTTPVRRTTSSARHEARAPTNPAPLAPAVDPVAPRHAVRAPADRARTHGGRHYAARAAASTERRRIHPLRLDSRSTGTDLALLVTIVFATGLAYLLGRLSQRQPSRT